MKGQKKGFKHSKETKKQISRTLKGRGCGGFNVKVKCPICSKDMNPANLKRHTEACERAIKYAYLFPNPKNSRELKVFKQKLRINHGITIEQYAEMFDKQNGVCYICGKKDLKPLSIDHCHKSGKKRKLLCNNCNLILGLCYENKTILKKIIDYIDEYKD